MSAAASTTNTTADLIAWLVLTTILAMLIRALGER